MHACRRGDEIEEEESDDDSKSMNKSRDGPSFLSHLRRYLSVRIQREKERVSSFVYFMGSFSTGGRGSFPSFKTRGKGEGMK